MKKFILSMAGAATFLASAAILIDFGHRQSKNAFAHPLELTAGILGSIAGFGLAVLAEVDLPKKKLIGDLDLEDMLDEEDIALMNENISDVLGASAEQTVKPEALRKIELDEDASIEDFI